MALQVKVPIVSGVIVMDTAVSCQGRDCCVKNCFYNVNRYHSKNAKTLKILPATSSRLKTDHSSKCSFLKYQHSLQVLRR